MSEWGLWDDQVDETLRVQLITSYIRRKRFEARLLAIEIGQLFAGRTHAAREVTPDEFLAIAGR